MLEVSVNELRRCADCSDEVCKIRIALHATLHLVEPAPGQLGSRFSQARGKRLSEEKGPRGPTHPATALHLKPELWSVHQPLKAPLPAQASFPLPPLSITSLPPHPTSHPSLFTLLVIHFLHHPTFIIRCLHYITTFYDCPPALWLSLTHPPLLNE